MRTNSGPVNQTQNSGEQQNGTGSSCSPQALVSTREGMDALGLADPDLQDARAAGDQALAEFTQLEPNRSRLRRAVNALKGVLAPGGAGLTAGAAAGAQDLAVPPSSSSVMTFNSDLDPQAGAPH